MPPIYIARPCSIRPSICVKFWIRFSSRTKSFVILHVYKSIYIYDCMISKTSYSTYPTIITLSSCPTSSKSY